MSNSIEWTKMETEFCAKHGYAGLVGNMEFSVFPADKARPDTMFCRIGLCTLKNGLVAVSVEADQRLWQAYLHLIPCEPDYILSILRGSDIEDRQKMLVELPAMAERHEEAWKQIKSAEALIKSAQDDLIE